MITPVELGMPDNKRTNDGPRMLTMEDVAESYDSARQADIIFTIVKLREPKEKLTFEIRFSSFFPELYKDR